MSIFAPKSSTWSKCQRVKLSEQVRKFHFPTNPRQNRTVGLNAYQSKIGGMLETFGFKQSN